DRNRRFNLYPDWRDVTPEQRAAYMAEDKARLRELAGQKMAAGTALTFTMDLEGKDGPHQVQDFTHLWRNPKEAPLARVERQLREWKEAHLPPARNPNLPAGRMGDLIHGLLDHSWGSGLSEAGK